MTNTDFAAVAASRILGDDAYAARYGRFAWLAIGAAAIDASDRPDPTNATSDLSSAMVRTFVAAFCGSSASSNSLNWIVEPLSGPAVMPPASLISLAASCAPDRI